MNHGGPHVQLERITKRFGATVAVDAVDIAFQRGSVHALVGENGAGKSTLGRIVAGVFPPDAGELRLAGRPMDFRSPRHALQHGITMIAQELSLVPARSAIENIFLGIEDDTFGVVLDRSLRRRFDDLVERSEIRVPPDVPVRNLPVADQQKVEILRALARRAELVIMDEPTARLSSSETEHLRQIVKSLATAGTTVIFISHFLEEVLEIADVVTIMRDGRIVRSGPVADETRASLIEGMIGRSLESTFPPKRRPPLDSPDVLRVEGLARDGVFADITFAVRAGEIVAMAGLVGSGRSEVARAIFGADRLTAGTVAVRGRPLRINSPRDAIAGGLAMIPESRKEEGLFLGRSIRENVSLPHLDRFSSAGVIRPMSERRRTAEMVRDVGVRGASLDATARSVSGGNQQKMLFARWLLAEPSMLIADEPTRGVDVGSKRNIYDLLARLASEGMGVLVISSELEEVLGLAHRILVMRNGKLVAELDGDTATEQDIMAAAFGAPAAA